MHYQRLLTKCIYIKRSQFSALDFKAFVKIVSRWYLITVLTNAVTTYGVMWMKDVHSPYLHQLKEKYFCILNLDIIIRDSEYYKLPCVWYGYVKIDKSRDLITCTVI